MLKLTFIAMGGAGGSVLRYIVTIGCNRYSTLLNYPVGTLIANVTGCFLIGLLATLLTGAGPFVIREEYRLGLLVGLLGGYTTFSTFGYESLGFLQDELPRIALLNLLLNNGLGILAVWLGNRMAVWGWGI